MYFFDIVIVRSTIIRKLTSSNCRHDTENSEALIAGSNGNNIWNGHCNDLKELIYIYQLKTKTLKSKTTTSHGMAAHFVYITNPRPKHSFTKCGTPNLANRWNIGLR